MSSFFKVFVLTYGLSFSLFAAAPTPAPTPIPTVERAPVIVDGKTLFYVRERALSFSPADRARAIAQRLNRLSKDPLLRVDNLRIEEGENTTDIALGETVLMTLTDRDALSAGKDRAALAQERMIAIKKALLNLQQDYSLKATLLGIFFTLLATASVVAVLKLLGFVFPKITRTLSRWNGTLIRSIRIQNIDILTAGRMTEGLIGSVRLLRLFVILLIFYIYVPLVLSFFPWTRGFAGTIIGYIVDPLTKIGFSLLSFLPNLFFIVVIFVVTRYVLKTIRLFFTEIQRGTISFSGFYSDWAEPTYKIVRFLVLAFAAVVIFPYLPGSQSPAFRGVSIFVGVLFSLGSTSAVANVVAGTVLTYMRPFRVGDRVKIADTVGDVVEGNLLVTRVRTIKNVMITVPNAMVLGSHIVNYSSDEKDQKLILHTTVTIGYDAPWKKVHELLIGAARNTKGIASDPTPFVFQTSLDDFYVSYEINAYTDQPHVMARIYSDLHQNIQDEFNKAGVEILSPHYGALRDGNQVGIPTDYLPKEYKAPSFRIKKTTSDST